MTISFVVLNGYNSFNRAASLLKPTHLSPADCEDSHPLPQSRSSIRYETVTSFWIRRSHEFSPCLAVSCVPASRVMNFGRYIMTAESIIVLCSISNLEYPADHP